MINLAQRRDSVSSQSTLRTGEFPEVPVFPAIRPEVRAAMEAAQAILDAMEAAKAGAELLAAAYRAAWQSVTRCIAQSPGISESRDMSQESRDSPEMSRDMSRDSAASPSLLKDSDLKEREKGKGGVGERGPLPPDWQPDAEVRAMAVERLGEIGTANLIANFREHYSDDPRLLTPRQWRRLFRDTWVRRQRSDSPQLPLLVPVQAKEKPPPGKVYVRWGSPQWEAWKRRIGSFPRDRGGGWWFPSEWPPDHDERQAS